MQPICRYGRRMCCTVHDPPKVERTHLMSLWLHRNVRTTYTWFPNSVYTIRICFNSFFQLYLLCLVFAVCIVPFRASFPFCFLTTTVLYGFVLRHRKVMEIDSRTAITAVVVIGSHNNQGTEARTNKATHKTQCVLQ